ncbi:hypothetical protein ACQ86N_32210 [Puia sp. P3]|uniref:hypothetical protein n=1 Tax=Puia sp. P3 TaxID=3423952 RepID=UPI003D67459F
MRRLLFPICLVVLFGGYVQAQPADSKKLHLDDLFNRWHSGLLRDTDYLRGGFDRAAAGEGG